MSNNTQYEAKLAKNDDDDLTKSQESVYKPALKHLPTTPDLHVYRTQIEALHEEELQRQRDDDPSAVKSGNLEELNSIDLAISSYGSPSMTSPAQTLTSLTIAMIHSSGKDARSFGGQSLVSAQSLASQETPLQYAPLTIPLVSIESPPLLPVTQPHDFDLLEWFKNKLNDDRYRLVKFDLPNDKVPLMDEYNRRVSFDTVNLQYAEELDDDDSASDEDQWPSPHMERGRQRIASPIASPLLRSPGRGSPTRQSIDLSDFSKYFMQGRMDYPTTPIITHRGCTFTREHPAFQDLYQGKLPGMKPVLPGRVILIYLSGRKHTWVGLDWVLNKFLEDGDRIVVVSAINLKLMLKSSKKYQKHGRFAPVTTKTLKMRLRQRNRPEYIKILSRDIMEYIMYVIDPSVIAKVSIELAVGRTKDVLKGMYKLYEPNLVCTGTKLSTRNSAPLKSWLSSKLTDRLIKNFPLPVIAVPAMNMNKLELDLEVELNKRSKEADARIKNNPYRLRLTAKVDAKIEAIKVNQVDSEDTMDTTSSVSAKAEESDVESILSDDSEYSLNSGSSDGSYSSYDEIAKLYQEYKSDITKTVKVLLLKPIDEEYYTNLLKPISDKSSALCQEFQGIDPDFRGKGAKVARAITGSNSFGVVPYKTKSLLDPVEAPKKQSAAPGLSFKEMKKNLRMNSISQELSASPSPPESDRSLLVIPQINIRGPESPEEGARKSSLKFVNLESPSQMRLQEELVQKKNANKSKLLTKSLSYDQDDGHHAPRPKLEPLKSHPDIHMIDSTQRAYEEKDEKKKKSKKKKFWKLFS